MKPTSKKPERRIPPKLLQPPLKFSDTQPLLGVTLGDRSVIRDLIEGKLRPSTLREIHNEPR